jgi:hypothetical protein
MMLGFAGSTQPTFHIKLEICVHLRNLWMYIFISVISVSLWLISINKIN